VSAFASVIHVDAVERTAVVGGMTTYEDLCAATLPHKLMPLVVPQLKTITLGGAVTGLGIESTSLWNGLPHESVTEMEILTGDGRVVTATRTTSTVTCSTASPTPTGRSATHSP
jgi:FAD/FMN-containing dehydrogenase